MTLIWCNATYGNLAVRPKSEFYAKLDRWDIDGTWLDHAKIKNLYYIWKIVKKMCLIYILSIEVVGSSYLTGIQVLEENGAAGGRDLQLLFLFEYT